jgi:hypothetical protein
MPPRVGTCAQSLALMTLVTTTACVVPIPASPVEEDGGAPNGLPDIAGASPAEFKFPGPIDLDPSKPQSITVTLKDMDLDDTLYVRVFRNYPENPGFIDSKFVTNDATLGKAERQLPLSTANWCFGAPESEQLILLLVVADREFDEDNTKQPPFQAVTTGGLTSAREWVARCVTPPQ